MRLAKPARVALLLGTASAAFILACGERGGSSRAKPDTTTARASDSPPAGQFTVSSQPLGPIPPDDALARPKPLHQVGVPLALTRSVTPKDNPQTPGKIALGEKLFFDGRVSANGTVACSTCHDPRLAFTDGRAVAVGIRSRVGQRNSLTVLNALYNKTQFWDGRVATLEQQAGLPIVNPVEMGNPNLDSVAARLATIPEYLAGFHRVFGRPPNATDLVRAIASYERSQISFDSPFDHFIAGDPNAINASAKRGWVLFRTRGRCSLCHASADTTTRPARFTDDQFHNIGVGILRHHVVALARQAQQSVARGDTIAIDRAAILTPMSALGRFLITRADSDLASFKSPDLRNVLVTAPYFHDGSAATLWDVIDHYNKGGGLQNPWLSTEIQPLALHETDIDDLVAYMASLTSPAYRELGVKELARQRRLSKTARPQRDSVRAFGPKPARPRPPGL